MKTTMVVYMNIIDESWMDEYFANVPPLLDEFGAVCLSTGRAVDSIEGDKDTPDRMTVIEFPSRGALDAFMADDRYRKYRDMREAGAKSNIFVFQNAMAGRGLA